MGKRLHPLALHANGDDSVLLTVAGLRSSPVCYGTRPSSIGARSCLSGGARSASRGIATTASWAAEAAARLLGPLSAGPSLAQGRRRIRASSGAPSLVRRTPALATAPSLAPTTAFDFRFTLVCDPLIDCIGLALGDRARPARRHCAPRTSIVRSVADGRQPLPLPHPKACRRRHDPVVEGTLRSKSKRSDLSAIPSGTSPRRPPTLRRRTLP